MLRTQIHTEMLAGVRGQQTISDWCQSVLIFNITCIIIRNLYHLTDIMNSMAYIVTFDS